MLLRQRFTLVKGCFKVGYVSISSVKDLPAFYLVDFVFVLTCVCKRVCVFEGWGCRGYDLVISWHPWHGV